MNIDRQAWLGEEVLAEPRPDMFRAQQLQVSGPGGAAWDKGRRLGRQLGGAEAGPDPTAEPERQRWWGWGGEESKSGCWDPAKRWAGCGSEVRKEATVKEGLGAGPGARKG